MSVWTTTKKSNRQHLVLTMKTLEAKHHWATTRAIHRGTEMRQKFNRSRTSPRRLQTMVSSTRMKWKLLRRSARTCSTFVTSYSTLTDSRRDRSALSAVERIPIIHHCSTSQPTWAENAQERIWYSLDLKSDTRLQSPLKLQINLRCRV